jgi:hypothetical protein
MNKQRLTELLERLSGMPDTIAQAASAESAARLARDEAKENVDIEVTNALISANGECDGKNAEERKLRADAYLYKHAGVKAARLALAAADGKLVDAQLETRRCEDEFAALRAEVRAIGSYLEYLAGEPRQNRR